jgi:hypothetical protein
MLRSYKYCAKKGVSMKRMLIGLMLIAVFVCSGNTLAESNIKLKMIKSVDETYLQVSNMEDIVMQKYRCKDEKIEVYFKISNNYDYTFMVWPALKADVVLNKMSNVAENFTLDQLGPNEYLIRCANKTLTLEAGKDLITHADMSSFKQ